MMPRFPPSTAPSSPQSASRRRPRPSTVDGSSFNASFSPAPPPKRHAAFLVDLGPPSRPQTSSAEDAAFWERLYRGVGDEGEKDKPPWFYYEPIPSPYLTTRAATSHGRTRPLTQLEKRGKRPQTTCIKARHPQQHASHNNKRDTRGTSTSIRAQTAPMASSSSSSFHNQRHHHVEPLSWRPGEGRTVATAPLNSLTMERDGVAMHGKWRNQHHNGEVPPYNSPHDEARAATIQGFVKEEEDVMKGGKGQGCMFLPLTLLYQDLIMSKPVTSVQLSGWPLVDSDMEAIAHATTPAHITTTITTTATSKGGGRFGRATKVTGAGADDKKVVKCTTLELARCTKITDAGLRCLPRFIYLTRLVLEGCHLVTDASMELIKAKVYRLNHINIKGCVLITDVGIRMVVSACRKLQEAIFADLPRLTDKSIAAISEAIRLYRILRTLDLSGSTHFSNEALLLLLQDGGGCLVKIKLGKCTQVNELGLMGMRRSGRFSMDVVTLDLSHTSINDPALCWISEGCKKLRHLHLQDCTYLQDSALLYLCQAGTADNTTHTTNNTNSNNTCLLCLQTLRLRNCRQITDYGLVPLLQSPTCSTLEALDVSGCPLLGNPTITAMAANLPHLRVCNLSGVTLYTDASFIAMCKACSCLATVDLSIDLNVLDTSHRSRIPRFTTAAIAAMGQYCVGMVEVRLSGASRVQDESLAMLGRCHGLKILVLDGCSNITDAPLLAIAEHCRQLEHVNLSFCGQVTDVGFSAIAASSGPTTLKVLEAQRCLKLTDAGLTAIGGHCRVLEVLDIAGCDYITDAGVEGFCHAQQQLGQRLDSRGRRGWWCRDSSIKTLILRGLDELEGITSIATVVKCLPGLWTLDCRMTRARADEMARLAPSLPYARKGDGNLLEPVEEPLRTFNTWLLTYRRRRTAAQVMQRLARGFLGRCRYLHQRAAMTRATIRLQKTARGFRGRRVYKWMLAVHLQGMRCAMAIQRAFRGLRGRKKAAEAREIAARRKQCAIMIQSLQRQVAAVRLCQHIQRRRLRVMRNWRVYMDKILRKAQRQLARESVRAIENGWISFILGRRNGAATLIQRAFRGHRARRRLYVQMCADLYRTNHAAAVIQRRVRRRRARKMWKKRLFRITLAEDAYREEYRRRDLAASMIQRAYRSMIKYREWQRRKPKRGWIGRAAVTIQKLVRVFLAKCVLHLLRMERDVYRDRVLIKWQVMVDKYYHHKARIIQRNWRLVVRRRRAAGTIQKCYRGYRGRVRMARLVRTRRREVLSTVCHIVWAYAKLRVHLQRGRSCRKIQRVYHRYRMLMKWREAVRGVREKQWQEALMEKQRRAAVAQRKLMLKMVGEGEERAAKQIQDYFRKFRERQRERERIKREEEARERARKEEARREEERRDAFDRAEEMAAKRAHQAIARVGNLITKYTTVAKPDGAEAVMKDIKAKAKRAAVLGNLADEESLKFKKEMDTQAEAAILQYHMRTTDIRGIVEFKLTVTMEARHIFEHQIKSDPSPMDWKMLSVDLSGREAEGVYLFYKIGDGAKAFRQVQLKDLPTSTVESERESRAKALKSIGVDTYGNPACRLEVHGYRSMDKSTRGCPVDDIRATVSVSEEEGLEKAGWTKLQPKLKRLGLGNMYLWTHSKAMLEKEKPVANNRNDELLAGYSWYDERLKKVMMAYALGADDVVRMYEEVFHGSLDYRGKDTIDEAVFFKWLDETPSVFGEWVMASVKVEDLMNITFSEFVNVVTILAMLGPLEAQRFVFGMLDERHSGFIHIEAFVNLMQKLKAIDRQKASAKKMELVFKKHMDKFGTLNFDTFSNHIAVGAVMWPLERLMAKTVERTLGEEFWREQKRRFAEARERLNIRKALG